MQATWLDKLSVIKRQTLVLLDSDNVIHSRSPDGNPYCNKDLLGTPKLTPLDQAEDILGVLACMDCFDMAPTKERMSEARQQTLEFE